MAVHDQQHKLTDAAHHLPGTPPGGKLEVNVVGTDGDSNIAVRTVEAYNSAAGAASQEKIVLRASGGHINVPDSATGKQAINYDQAVELNSKGPWAGLVKKHVFSEESRCDPSETYNLNEKVIQLDEYGGGRIYTVTGTGTSGVGGSGHAGNEVAWDYDDSTGQYGRLPDKTEIYLDTTNSVQVMYSADDDHWYVLGGAGGDAGPHRIDDGSKHFSNVNKFGILYTKAKSLDNREGVPAILSTVDADGDPAIKRGKPLLSAGDGTPMWGNLGIWPDIVSVSSLDTPSECNAWNTDTLGVVIHNGRFYLAYRAATDGKFYYVGMTR